MNYDLYITFYTLYDFIYILRASNLPVFPTVSCPWTFYLFPRWWQHALLISQAHNDPLLEEQDGQDMDTHA